MTIHLLMYRMKHLHFRLIAHLFIYFFIYLFIYLFIYFFFFFYLFIYFFFFFIIIIIFFFFFHCCNKYNVIKRVQYVSDSIAKINRTWTKKKRVSHVAV